MDQLYFRTHFLYIIFRSGELRAVLMSALQKVNLFMIGKLSGQKLRPLTVGVCFHSAHMTSFEMWDGQLSQVEAQSENTWGFVCSDPKVTKWVKLGFRISKIN